MTNPHVPRIGQTVTASRQALHGDDLVARTADFPRGEWALALSNVGATLELQACALLMLTKKYAEERWTRNACAGAPKQRVHGPFHEIVAAREEYRR